MPGANHQDVVPTDDNIASFHSINGDSVHRIDFDADTKEIKSRYSGKNANPRVTVRGKPKALSFKSRSGSSIIKAGNPWIEDEIKTVQALLTDNGEDGKIYQMSKKARETFGSGYGSKALPPTSPMSFAEIKPGELWTEDHIETVHSLIADTCDYTTMHKLFKEEYGRTGSWSAAAQTAVVAGLTASCTGTTVQEQNISGGGGD